MTNTNVEKTNDYENVSNNTISNDPINDLEERDIQIRASRVSALIKQSTAMWLEVATEVCSAKLTLKQHAYEIFLERTSISQSVADKLLKIASQRTLYSERATSHLKRIDGWTTLYEIAKLKPAKINELLHTLDDDPTMILSRSAIQQFREHKTKSAAAPKVTVATIKVSEVDLLRLDFEQFLKFKDSLDDVQRIIDRCSPAVSMNVSSKEIQRLEEKLVNASSEDAESEHLDFEDEPIPSAQQHTEQVSLSLN